MSGRYDRARSDRPRSRAVAGTPYCLTIDHETLNDKAVTIRDRDTLAQRRIPLDAVPAELDKLIDG